MYSNVYTTSPSTVYKTIFAELWLKINKMSVRGVRETVYILIFKSEERTHDTFTHLKDFPLIKIHIFL